MNLGLKSIIFIIIIGLTSCGGNDPKDVVEDYINAWNSGDLEEVISYTDKDLSKEIQNDIDNCIENKMSSIIDEKFNLYMKDVDKVWRENNPFSVIQKVKPPKDFLKKVEEITTDKSLNYKVRTEKIGLLMFSISDVYQDIKSTISPISYRMLAFSFANKMKSKKNPFSAINNYERKIYFKQIILEDMKKNNNNGIKEKEDLCKKEFFKPDSITDINILETIDKSVDRKNVRVELIKNNDSSKKDIYVELVNKKWVVSTSL